MARSESTVHPRIKRLKPAPKKNEVLKVGDETIRMVSPSENGESCHIVRQRERIPKDAPIFEIDALPTDKVDKAGMPHVLQTGVLYVS